MNEPKRREFYELCQKYRHAPLRPQIVVTEFYEDLISFVDKELLESQATCARDIEIKEKDTRIAILEEALKTIYQKSNQNRVAGIAWDALYPDRCFEPSNTSD